MQQYTDRFGEMKGEPFVKTTCKVIEQSLGGNRRNMIHESDRSLGGLLRRLFFGTYNNKNASGNRLGNRRKSSQQQQQKQDYRQLQTGGTGESTDSILVLDFTMTYESRYGIDVTDYPSYFKTYVNDNLGVVTSDMQNKFLPVAQANQVILFLDTPPSPQPSDNSIPTVSPTRPTMSSELPSFLPTKYVAPPDSSVTTQPTNVGFDDGDDKNSALNKQTSFIVGMVAGLVGAALIVFLLICYMKRRNVARKKNSRQAGAKGGGGGYDGEIVEGNSEDASVAVAIPVHGSGNTYIRKITDDGVVVVMGDRGIEETIASNPSLVSGGGSGSFSSDSDQNYENNGLRSLQDEFDMHKNQNKDLMKNGESSAERMMCVAMTRALMDDEDNMDKNQWGSGKRGKGGGADNEESMEANALCETHDWLRKNERSSLEERYVYSPSSVVQMKLSLKLMPTFFFPRNAFFQQMLNRMVYTVRQGLNPSDGTLVIHSCAAMLGLQLEKDLPNNVLLVTGLLKTRDTTQGRKYLVEAFEPFGAIESAAISSSNRGFGFVRFVHPISVQRALQRFRTSEIEVQDVSVMIRPLKS